MLAEQADEETGEIFALVPLGTWQVVVAMALAAKPCARCSAPSCKLARLVCNAAGVVPENAGEG